MDIWGDASGSGLENTDPKLRALLEEAGAAQQNQTLYQQVLTSLFPGGIPTSRPNVQSGTAEGARSIAAGLGIEPTQLGSAIGQAAGSIGEAFGAVAPFQYTDPDTGAIRRENGVLVDPTADPQSGVIYPPNSDAEGSYRWLNNASEWGEARVKKWREKLQRLGYDIPDRGDFDEGLRNALDLYFRRRYFYGKDIKLDAASGGRQRAEDVMDPVEIRQDVRAAYQTVFGDDPSDAEIEVWEDSYRRTLNKILSRGVAPEAAVLRSKEKFATRVSEDPGVQKFTELETENTELHDSMTVLMQSLSNLA